MANNPFTEGLVTTRPLKNFFAEKHGGKWVFDNKLRRWNCDDGERYIAIVAGSMHDENAISQYWLYYHDDRTPERAL